MGSIGYLNGLSGAIGRITIREAAALTSTSRNTLKPHLRQLVERRQLVLHGSGRGAWYALL